MLINSWSIFLLSTLTSIVEAIKCFAGDPLLKHECTTMSYCLMILNKSGRTQWSCDGNGFSQPSICSTLGLELGQRQIFETGSSEASFYRTQDLPRGSKIDPRISGYNGQQGTVSDQGSSVVSRLMGSETAAIKCYDGGDLGKICCCADNFCNTSTRVFRFEKNLYLVIFCIFVVFMLTTIKFY